MRRAIVVTIVPALLGLVLHGTASPQAPKAFEVVSVRPRDPRTAPVSRPTSKLAGSHFELSQVKVGDIIQRAYGVESFRIVLPEWTRTAFFDIQGVLPSGASVSDVPEMLQTLLMERFAFRMHREPRLTPVYELTIGPAGIKFSESPATNDFQTAFASDGKAPVHSDSIAGLPGDELRSITRTDGSTREITARTMYDLTYLPGMARQIDATRMTMAQLTTQVAGSLDRPLLDKTGLTSVYSFKVILPPRLISPNLRAALGDPLAADPSGVSVFKAVEELGLKLESKKSLLEFIVVEAVERPAPD